MQTSERINQLRSSGLSAPAIAMKLKLSRGHVYGVLRKSKRRSVPKGLNGLAKKWTVGKQLEAKANRMLKKAKRILVAVKELDAALRS